VVVSARKVRLKPATALTSAGKIPASAIKFKDSSNESERIMGLQNEVLALQAQLKSSEEISQKKIEQLNIKVKDF
jgi:hypothetical protein